MGLVVIDTVLIVVGRQVYIKQFAGDWVVLSCCVPSRHNKHCMIQVAGVQHNYIRV